MNELQPMRQPDDDRRFDLLVDGEMDGNARRDLLAGLDDEPGGWRRCALAFLEAQAWRDDLLGVVDGRTVVDSRGAVEGGPALSRRPATASHGRIVPLLTLAAGLLIAFTLGMLLQRDWLGRVLPGGDQFVSTDVAPPVVESPPVIGPPMEAAAGLAAGELQPGDEGALMLVVGGGPSRQEFRVPLVDAAEVDERLEWSDTSSVTPAVERYLDTLGHRVERRRRLAPLQLPGGRRMLVPVEDVEIVPAAMRGY